MAEIYRHPIYVALCTIYIPSKLYLMKIYITRSLYSIITDVFRRNKVFDYNLGFGQLRN